MCNIFHLDSYMKVMNQLSILIINKSDDSSFLVIRFCLKIEEIKTDIFPDVVSALSSLDLRNHQYVWEPFSKIVNPCKKTILCTVLMAT